MSDRSNQGPDPDGDHETSDAARHDANGSGRRHGGDGTRDDEALDREIAALLTDPTLWQEPSAGVEERVVAAVTAERNAVQTVADAPTSPGSVLALKTGRRNPWQGRLVSAALGAAAAAVLVVALTARDDAPVADAPAADARVELVGTELAPNVSGRAAVTRFESGVEISFAVPGLPRRDGDEFYQGWLKNCAGTLLVSIGSFHDLDNAWGWAGVDIADFPIVTVTREQVAGPTDAAQGSSGEMVVSGTLTPCPAG